jgi:hypothetical protein
MPINIPIGHEGTFMSYGYRLGSLRPLLKNKSNDKKIFLLINYYEFADTLAQE